jgi:hypothetical protein
MVYGLQGLSSAMNQLYKSATPMLTGIIPELVTKNYKPQILNVTLPFFWQGY